MNLFKLGLTPSQLIVAQYLFSNPDSSVHDIAIYVPASEKTIRRALKRLEDLGVVEVTDVREHGRKSYSVANYGGYSMEDYE